MYNTLNKILTERKISKAQLARRADINQSDIYAVLAGKRPAFPAWRRRVAAVLGVPEGEIFPESEA
ncbi:MAG TPA: hypothetical protein DCK76_12005 [Desulfotomaculum sp.]|nr:MAG: Uncharacterized protein XD84_1966 [Desulfotomaculum sp. 46_80]HAG12061.1 hypothetical protein [Desulfotomaculum sp.]HBY04205.1 hypothetical protein [Desulfotomaculum sp.]